VKVVAVPLGKVDLEVPSLGILHLVATQLALPRMLPLLLLVIFLVDHHTGLILLQVRHDIAPALVVVHTKRNDEILAVISLEAQGAGGTTTTHGKNMLIVGDSPCAAIGVLPHRFFDKPEECVWVGLINAHSNLVGHSKEDRAVDELN
jgi:hypothetical protein